MATIYKILNVGAAGNRGTGAEKKSLKHNIGFDFTGAVDPDPERLRNYIEWRKSVVGNTPKIYSSLEEALDSKDEFDAVFINTPDETHKDLAILTLEKGYPTLLEKPMATNAEDCIEIYNAAEQSGQPLSIFHTLRHTPYSDTIRDVIDSKELGRITTIDHTENAAFWHFAHSYSKGNWRNGVFLKDKSCHDIDLMRDWASSIPTTVISFGATQLFKPEMAPENAADNCYKCNVDNCVFEADPMYNEDHIFKRENGEKIKPLDMDYPYFVPTRETDFDKRREIIKKSPYSECAFKAPHKTIDTQDVIMMFENGIYGNFRLRYGGPDMTRLTTIEFEKGRLRGDMFKGKLKMDIYNANPSRCSTKNIELPDKEAHGGGDKRLLTNFYELLKSGDCSLNRTNPYDSTMSHLMVFAAEESRKKGGMPVNFRDYLSRFDIKSN